MFHCSKGRPVTTIGHLISLTGLTALSVSSLSSKAPSRSSRKPCYSYRLLVFSLVAQLFSQLLGSYGRRTRPECLSFLCLILPELLSGRLGQLPNMWLLYGGEGLSSFVTLAPPPELLLASHEVGEREGQSCGGPRVLELHPPHS